MLSNSEIPSKWQGRKSDYIFESTMILKELAMLKDYFIANRFNENTIRQNINYTGYFLQWTEAENLSPKEIRYADLLAYIDYCTKQGSSLNHTNRKLLAIRHYYTHLQKTEKHIINPASGLFIRGKVKKIHHNLLTAKEMEELYQEYQVSDERTQRNKVIISLLIYQAVTTRELKRLEPAHINLKEGKINIPGSNKSNTRQLKLESIQILELYHYINITRPKILKELTAVRSGRRPQTIKDAKNIDQLFISISGSEEIKNSLNHLMKALKNINPKVMHAKQIRISVITEWLKTEEIRQVQYKAGHKYISGTEYYKVHNPEELKEALNVYHPLS